MNRQRETAGLKFNIFSYGFYPEQFLINDFAAEVAKNHPVVVFTGLPNYPRGHFFKGYSLRKGPYSETMNGFRVIRYPVVPRRSGFLMLLVNYISHLVGALFSLARLPKADWIFVFAISPITISIPAIVFARLTGARVCLWLQDLWPDSISAVGAFPRTSPIYRLTGFIVRWIYKRLDIVLIQSPDFSENLQEFGFKGESHFIPNWAVAGDFSNPNKPVWFDRTESDFVVTFAGNIGKAQSMDTILEAVAFLQKNHSLECQKIKFVFVGDGSDLERAKSIVLKRSLANVVFLGRRPVGDMPGLFSHSDLLLVTLKKDPIFARTIPSKVQSYMAAGVPIVASLDGSGARVIQEAQCGGAVPAEQPETLARLILSLSQMSLSQRKSLGENARKYFEKNYRMDTIIAKILEILKNHGLK